MNVIDVNGLSLVAGLYWLERGNGFTVASNARKFRRACYVHLESQTGYAPADGDTEGLPSLAAVLRAAIPGDFWMALVEGSNGRFAIVKVREGAVLADGDELFDNREDAIEAFQRTRNIGWSLYATPGLVPEPVVELDLAGLHVEPVMKLRRALLSRKPRQGRVVLSVLATAASVCGWLYWDELTRLMVNEERPAKSVPGAAPKVSVSIDSDALLDSCSQALDAHPPWIPAWRTRAVSCQARFDDRAFIALHPELAGRPVMLVRWRLESGRAAPAHRQIAETHLSGWYSGSVAGTEAWALIPLKPVVQAAAENKPGHLQLRRSVDRQLGLKGVKVNWLRAARGKAGSPRLRITTAHSLTRIRTLLGAVSGLEVTGLSLDSRGEWSIDARGISPVQVPGPEYNRLTGELEHDA